MTDSKKLTVSYTTFNHNDLTFTTLEENDRSKGQLIAYPRYNHPTLGQDKPLMLQCSWSEVFTYGVPRAGDYYENDQQRSFLKLPVDPNNEEMMKLVSKLEEFDNLWGSDKKKKELFGKKAKKYVYNKIVRESQTDEDQDEKPRYIKLKLETSWPDNDIKTQVYNSELVDENSEKRKRTKVEVKTVDDFASIVRWKSKVRPIIRPVKMWAQPSSRKDPGYGVTWKIVKIEVEAAPQGGSSLKDYYNNDAFLDSDSDDEADVSKIAPEAVAEDDSDSSDSDSSDSDDEDSKKTTKSKSKKKSL